MMRNGRIVVAALTIVAAVLSASATAASHTVVIEGFAFRGPISIPVLFDV